MFNKQILIKLNWLLKNQFGIDPLKFIKSIKELPVYLNERSRFRKNFRGKLKFMPCLHDRYEEAGAIKSEYFWQDLLVARAIFEAKPQKHVDIGSRVDGFVAHIASFRECEVFDVRNVSVSIPGVLFRQADLMNLSTLPDVTKSGYCDSLSCLHAIEHFGLGRYGDPINPLGYKQGLINMTKLLKSGGIFYLSTPIGIERVEFNANWVFDPINIIFCVEAEGLKLQRLILINHNGFPQESKLDNESISKLAAQTYQLGLFVFKK